MGRGLSQDINTRNSQLKETPESLHAAGHHTDSALPLELCLFYSICPWCSFPRSVPDFSILSFTQGSAQRTLSHGGLLSGFIPPYTHQFSSVQFSCSVVSNSLRPHESQHARPPCPSSTPGVHSDSRPSSQWCHPAISSSVVPFSSCSQSLPASGSFPMSQLFAWGGQSTGVSALASVLPKNTQGWSPLEWTGWISLQSRDSQESSPTPQFKSINSSVLSFLCSPTLTSIYDHRKNHSLD